MALLKQYKAHQAQERLKVGDLWRGSGVLSNFVELFDTVTPRDISGAQFLKKLREQADVIDNWEKNIQTLADRKIDEDLIKELRQFGLNAGLEIAALQTLTDKQLKEFVSLWHVKNKEPRNERLFTT